MTRPRLEALLESLAGQQPAPTCNIPDEIILLEDSAFELGYSQFNELMLLLGLNRVSQAFFAFLLDAVVVKILVAFSVFKRPEFPAAFPSLDSATRFRPVTSSGYRRSSAGDASHEPPHRPHAAGQGSQHPGQHVAPAA